MSDINVAALLARLALLEAQQTEARAKQPIAQISLWPNTKRRADKNDAQFTGRIQLSYVRMLEDLRADLSEESQAALDVVLAEVIGEALTTREAFLDIWQNAPAVGKSGGDKPILSGRARNFVDGGDAAGDAQSESIVAALSAAAGK